MKTTPITIMEILVQQENSKYVMGKDFLMKLLKGALNKSELNSCKNMPTIRLCVVNSKNQSKNSVTADRNRSVHRGKVFGWSQLYKESSQIKLT